MPVDRKGSSGGGISFRVRVSLNLESLFCEWNRAGRFVKVKPTLICLCGRLGVLWSECRILNAEPFWVLVLDDFGVLLDNALCLETLVEATGIEPATF
jgi:hypothetical protein